MFQIEGRDVIFDWLGHQSDTRRCEVMLDWLIDFANAPLRDAHRVPAVSAPAYLRIVPLKEPAVVKFLYAEQFRTVKVIEITPLP